MTDDEMKAQWRQIVARKAAGFVHQAKCSKFFEKFDYYFQVALQESGLSLEDLKWAWELIDTPRYDERRVQEIVALMWQALWSRLDLPFKPLREKVFRPGSGQVRADGGNQSVMKVKAPREPRDKRRRENR